jgi:hypothetical protein
VTIGFKFDVPQLSPVDLFRLQYKPIARAATKAVTSARDYVITAGAANIAGAGFGPRWQKALAGKVYPQGKDSVDAAAFIYHRIPYANVFEKGATISGRPTLWLPLPELDRVRVGRAGSKVTPAKLARAGYKLQVVRRPGRRPLIFMNQRQGGKKVSVPVFVGVPRVSIRKKFNILGIARQASGRLPEFYSAAFQDRI